MEDLDIDIARDHFNRIRFLDALTNQMIRMAEDWGFVDFAEYTDMNCGAIPQGDFDTVIDAGARRQFLVMYTNIAEARFAFTAIVLKRKDVKYFETLCALCFEVGKSFAPGKFDSVFHAFCFICKMLLDGMPGDRPKEITLDTDTSFEWMLTSDTHQSYWDNFGGNGAVKDYYVLTSYLIAGFLSLSDIRYTCRSQKYFCLAKS